MMMMLHVMMIDRLWCLVIITNVNVNVSFVTTKKVYKLVQDGKISVKLDFYYLYPKCSLGYVE